MKTLLLKNTITQTPRTESGRTMLEMLGVLGIMGIITYGAIAGINYGMSSYKINQTYSEVQDIIQGVEDLYSWSQEYETNQKKLMEAATENKIFTNNTLTSDDGLYKVQGSLDKIWIEAADGGNNFEVHVSVPKSDDCTRLANMDWAGNNIKCRNAIKNNCNCEDSQILVFSPL